MTDDLTPNEMVGDLDAAERQMTWLYDQYRARAEAEPNWAFTQGNVAQAVAEWRCFRMFVSLGPDKAKKADDYAERCRSWLSAAAEDMRGRRRDTALAETADLLHRDVGHLREASAYRPAAARPA